MFDYSHLTKLGVVKKFVADEVFFNEGDPGQEMYIVLKGRVGVYAKCIEGSFVKVAEIGAGGFFGEMSLLEGLPRSASVSALEDTIVIELDSSNFNSVISHSPEFAFLIMKGLSSRVRRMTEEMVKKKEGSGEADEPAVEGRPEQASLPKEDDKLPALSPENAKKDVKAPASHAQYLFEKEMECPVCGQYFAIQMIRNSKLRAKGLQPDLRQCYEGFEPLWYMVWACPHCGYANFNDQFKQVTEEQKDKILRDQLQDEKGRLAKLKFKYSNPRTFGEVLRAYELLHENFSYVRTSSEQYAKFWLRLSWLYSDAGMTELYEQASRKALEYYKDIYFNSRTTSAEQEARLCLIMGELYLRLKNYPEAIQFYRKAIMHRGGNPVVNRQAEDRLAELKKLMKEAN